MPSNHMSLFGSLAVPHCSLLLFPYNIVMSIPFPQPALRVRIPLIGSLAVPAHGLGANIRFADGEPGNHVVIKDGMGVDTEAMISTDTDVPVTETGFALNIDEGTPLTDGEEYTFEFAMVDSAGQPVTVTHTARWQSE